MTGRHPKQATASPEVIWCRLQTISDTAPLAVVLIGGCSRSGKSFLARQLREVCQAKGIPALLLPLDAWIVSAERRPANSTVCDRFEGDRIEQALQDLLAGRTIYPPVYDAASRRRVAERGDTGWQLERGLLLVDGVLALVLPGLRAQADLKIFVALPDEVRNQRLLEFYTGPKGFSLPAAAALIIEREKEEVATVKASQRFADLIYQSAGDNSLP